MTKCWKGCQQREGCVICNNKDKNPICPCRECLVKAICKKQCSDRKDLFYAYSIKEYYNNRETIHERIVKSNEVMAEIMLQERQIVTAHINRKGNE
jgi:hypothetical protein